MNCLKIICRYLFLIILPISSCVDEFLTKDPQAIVFENTLANQGGIDDLLIGAYAELDGVSPDGLNAGSGSNWIAGDVYTDEAYTGSELSDFSTQTLIEIETFKQTSAHVHYLAKWKIIYDGISRSNDVIRVTKLAIEKGSINEDQSIEFFAEARFLRAYYHLEAIKYWDYIPFIDENNLDGLVENYPDSTVPNTEDTKWGGRLWLYSLG